MSDTDLTMSSVIWPKCIAQTKRKYLLNMSHKKEHERVYNLFTSTRVNTGAGTYVLN